MKKPPFETNLNTLIEVWCQWCIEVGQLVPLHEWIGFAHHVDVHAIIRAAEDAHVAQTRYTTSGTSQSWNTPPPRGSRRFSVFSLSTVSK